MTEFNDYKRYFPAFTPSTDTLLKILYDCKCNIKADLNFSLFTCSDEKAWGYISSGKFVNPEFPNIKTKQPDPTIEYVFKDRYKVYLHNLEDLSGYISIGGFGKGFPCERFIHNLNEYKSLIPGEKLLYQEDSIGIIHKLTGWSASKCNLGREFICKNEYADIVQSKFIQDSVKNGYSEKYAEQIVKELQLTLPCIKTRIWSFFYAFILYQLAYISLYYPMEYAEIIAKYE